MKTYLLCLCLIVSVLLLSGDAVAEEEFVIENPRYDAYLKEHPLETTPRDPDVVEAEKQQMVAAAQAVVEYAREHGFEQASAEITKGKDGVFATYHGIGPQFRMMTWKQVEKAEGEEHDFLLLGGHNLMLNLVGMKFDLELFADLSGWRFLDACQKTAFSEQGKGWAFYDFWADEYWADMKVVRFTNYSQVIDRKQGTMIMIAVAIDE